MSAPLRKIGSQRARKVIKLAHRTAFRPDQRQQGRIRLPAFRDDVGDIHAHELLRHGRKRVFRKKMDTLDDRILGRDQAGRDFGHVVAQSVCAGRGC